MNEALSHPAPLVTALTGVGPANTQSAGGCFKGTVGRRWEANQNIFLNDYKLLNTGIFNSCGNMTMDINST